MEKDDDSKDTYLKLDDGTKYPYSYSVDRDSDERDHMVYDLDSLGDRTHPTLGDDYTLYLDPNGYVLGFAKDEGETKYLYVEDSDEELKDWVAKVVLTDGTNPKVDVKEDLKKTPDEIGDKIAWTQKARCRQVRLGDQHRREGLEVLCQRFRHVHPDLCCQQGYGQCRD